MARNLLNNLDNGKADTGNDDAEVLIVVGPTWMLTEPFDDISRDLLAVLERAGWRVVRMGACVRVDSPFLAARGHA